MALSSDPKSLTMLGRLRDDFEYYAPNALMIKTKKSEIEPLVMNSAQLYLHRRAEQALSLYGRVRFVILKGRQQGISTYIQARFYHKTSMRSGLRAFILTHAQAATDNLFSITKRYYDRSPPDLKPVTNRASAKELSFHKLDSGYKVATAGSTAVGRSDTIQLLHASEVAFWANAPDHMAGVGQALADEPGTESYLESTANGEDNEFCFRWNDAVAGLSEYVPIFIPWFWQTEYSKSVSASFHLDNEEAEYAERYGLTPFQMAWRRNKISSDFRGDVALFDQEYPAEPALAFRRVTGDPFIPTMLCLQSVDRNKNEDLRPFGPLILGVDPSEQGDDEAAFVFRQGFIVEKPIVIEGKTDPMTIAGVTARLIEERDPDAVFVDGTGVGSGTYWRLKELFKGDRPLIVRVMPGGTEEVSDRRVYANWRAEMWGNIRDWLREGGILPDSDEALRIELSGPGYKFNSRGQIVIEAKEDMLKRGVKSPNKADALGLTFAMPVQNRQPKTAEEAKLERWRKLLREKQATTGGSAMSA